MPEPEQDQDNQLTGDELSELHGLASLLQATGDPRAVRVWKVIDAQTDRDADRVPGFRVSRSPLKVTSWLQDLENTLWGDQPGAGEPQGLGATGNSTNVDGTDQGHDATLANSFEAQAPDAGQSTQPQPATNDGTSEAAGDASSDEEGDSQQEELLAQNAPAQQPGRHQQQPRQQPNQGAGQQQRSYLTQAERETSAGVAYSESTTGSVAEHEAIISVILNRAQSGDQRYVNRGQRVNVQNVIHAAPGGARQFQGVGGPQERNFAQINDQGSQNARTAAANIARTGPTNNATAIIVTGGREPTAREEGNLGNVHRTGRVGNVFLYEPGPAPETPVPPRRVAQPQRPRPQPPISSPQRPQEIPDDDQ